MKLYEIPQGSKIRLPLKREGAPEVTHEICTFNHLDGGYSHITTPDGATVHLSASAELTNNGDYYELSNI